MTRTADDLSQGTELTSLNGSSRNLPTESTPEDDYNAWKEATDDLNVTRFIITSAENGGLRDEDPIFEKELGTFVQIMHAVTGGNI